MAFKQGAVRHGQPGKRSLAAFDGNLTGSRFVWPEETKKMALAKTKFSVRDHAFHFINLFDFSFEFEVPLVGTVDLGHVLHGLCGGMCFAVLDYLQAGKPVPSLESVAEIGPDLLRYLRDRQLDSLSLPLGVAKVFEWMMRDDEDVWRLTAEKEFPKLRKRLDQGKQTVLALIRVRGLDNPTMNHQVLAHGYKFDETTKDLEVYLYDPNYPGQEPMLSMNLANPEQGINAAQSSGESLRGFFVVNYRPQTPP